MNRLPFTHFDLPRQHLSEQGHYIPPKSRDADEIAWRKSVPQGTVLISQQAKGFKIAHLIMRSVEEESLIYSANMISMAALNSSWYSFAKGAPDVMRRRLYLPRLADYESDWRQDLVGLRTEAESNLKTLVSYAGDLVLRSEASRLSRKSVTQLGRLAGSTALQFAILKADSLPAGNAFEVQQGARDLALETLDASRNQGTLNGSHVSIAQFADPDSPLSVEWRRNAPDQAYQALEEAHEILAFKVFSK